MIFSATGCENSERSKRDQLEMLRSLPYLSYSEKKVEDNRSGVVFHDPKRSCDGYNFYDCTLMDMQGRVVHKWPWKFFAVLLPEGDILAQGKDHKLFGRYKWNRQPVWEKGLHNHHEICLTFENTILIPSREVVLYKGRKVAFDTIVEFSLDGRRLNTWSTWVNHDMIRRFHEPSALDTASIEINRESNPVLSSINADYDYYHLNSIQVLPENPLGKKDPRFQTGNWLICLKHVNLILILDRSSREIVWHYGPDDLDFPHMPRMLAGGTILIYDNGFQRRKFTRVIEIHPVTNEIVWEYRADPPESFFSHSLGSAQHLPNGNTMIADSTNGRAFEVTREGDMVWEWFNPRMNKDKTNRAVFYRIMRYPRQYVEKILRLHAGE